MKSWPLRFIACFLGVLTLAVALVPMLAAAVLVTIWVALVAGWDFFKGSWRG